MDMRAILMGVAFAAMWASAFTSARMIVQDAPPLLALAVRFLASGLLAVIIARAIGQSWRLNAAQARATVIFGICQNALYLGLNFVAMQWVEASVAVIIAATMPLMVAFLGWMFLADRPPPRGILGLFIGVAGVALIMGTRMQGGPIDPMGLAFCLIGSLALAVATLSVRGATSGGNLLMVVGYQMFVAAILLFAGSLMLEAWQIDWTLQLGLAFGYTTLVPGLLATWLWFVLVGRIGAVRAATFHFLTPFLGVATAALLLGEALRLWDVIGVAIISIGIWAVQTAKQVKQT